MVEDFRRFRFVSGEGGRLSCSGRATADARVLFDVVSCVVYR